MQETTASGFTSKTSAVMQTPLPREWLLSGYSRLRKFDAEKISAGLNCLRADNFRMQISSQTFPDGWDSKEKWYGTEYKYEKIPADFLEEIKKAATSKKGERFPELHLPHVNEFIPTRLEVEKKEIETPAISPKLIRNDDSVRVWFKKDDTFWVPKGSIFIKCRNSLSMATAENFVKANLYTNLVYDLLKEYAYNAGRAGVIYYISNHSMGLTINVCGYNEKLPVLLEKVLTTMRDLEVKQDRFEIIKERLARGLKNWDFEQPSTQVNDCLRWLSSEKGCTNEESLSALLDVTAADIQQFYPRLLRQMHIETLVHGNFPKKKALKLADLTLSILKPGVLPQTQWPINKSFIFPPGANYVYHKKLKDLASVNHCTEYVLFVGDDTNRSQRAKTLLLEQMIHEPAFDRLRTKEQLGYTASSGISIETGTIAYTFTIQSEKTPQYLEERIDLFLVGYSQTLKNMSVSEFEGHKRSLIAETLEKLKNLDEESNRLWSHIESEELDFELGELYTLLYTTELCTNRLKVHHDATHIEALTKEDMIQFYNQFILPSSPLRSKLSIHLIAQGTSLSEANADQKTISMNNESCKDAEDGDGKAIAVKAEGNGTVPCVITDVGQFKAKLQTTPEPQPVKPISEFEEP
ncbi:hypothetical protein OCU04_004089 [Sclerotinia nivalis]|uniref:Insulin-degrading enzyme n=1 Tax=Sclerotinia nivalis TaxID=352851 RepID=A0A9X0DME0_9HELO|nr:hypothetical protein OCU04_004089 [Sclerotinia nivalis]